MAEKTITGLGADTSGTKRAPLDGMPDPAAKERCFALEYRFKNRGTGQTTGGVKTKAFWFKGDLPNARIAARRFCEGMGYTYINVDVFIIDLDEVLSRKSAFRDEDS